MAPDEHDTGTPRLPAASSLEVGGPVAPAAEEELELPAAPEPPEQLPPWSELSQARRQAILEALIFASEVPLSVKDLRELLGISRAELLPVIGRLRDDLAQHHRGLQLEEVAGGFVFRTRPELAPWLRALLRTRPPRISRAALETLAIVAYRQPVTRAEIEQVRGVDSGNILRTLLEKRLVRILGRKEDVGRPMIYGTTREFLQMFGLKDLTALPTLRDVQALMGRAQGPEPRDGLEEGGGALETPRAALPGPPAVSPDVPSLQGAAGAAPGQAVSAGEAPAEASSGEESTTVSENEAAS